MEQTCTVAQDTKGMTKRWSQDNIFDKKGQERKVFKEILDVFLLCSSKRLHKRLKRESTLKMLIHRILQLWIKLSLIHYAIYNSSIHFTISEVFCEHHFPSSIHLILIVRSNWWLWVSNMGDRLKANHHFLIHLIKK